MGARCPLPKIPSLCSRPLCVCCQNLHKELERKIADFHGREDAIVYASCFDANAGLFEVLLGADDAIISDELNHASIIDGIRLTKAKRLRYLHRDMNGESSLLDFKLYWHVHYHVIVSASV